MKISRFCSKIYKKIQIGRKLIIMKWEIRYYLTEVAYKSGIAAYKETINGDRNYAVNWAQNKLKCSNFKFYDLVQK